MITVGKTKIDIRARGCDRCGTEHSSGWFQVETVEIRVKTRSILVDIPRCADCVSNPTFLKRLDGGETR